MFVLNFKIKLFAAFTRERLFRSFTGLYLATHEFPKTALRLIRRTLSDKVPITITYDGSNDFNYAFVIH